MHFHALQYSSLINLKMEYQLFNFYRNLYGRLNVKNKTTFAALSCILAHVNFCTKLNIHFAIVNFAYILAHVNLII